MNRCNPKARRMSILQTLNRELGKKKKLKKKEVLMQKRWSLLPLYCSAFATGFSHSFAACIRYSFKEAISKGTNSSYLDRGAVK